MELRHTQILIVGFGKSGQAAARYCAERGARVTVYDAAQEERFADVRRQFSAWPITYCFGSEGRGTRDEGRGMFTAVDLIVASPGVPLTVPGLLAAHAVGTPIVSEMELALLDTPRPVIAVTGTNGKSTTTTLIGEILRRAGIPAAVGGNLGTPMCDLLPEARHAAWWVIEVSSSQLEITPSLQAKIGVLLNITPDHLDRYPDFAAYVAAKARLLTPLTPADTLIFNAEDPEVASLVGACAALKVPFAVASGWGLVAGSVGSDHPPATSHAIGASWNNGHVRAVVPGRMVQEWDLTQTQLIGAHNRENMLAAGLAAAAAGAPSEQIARTLREFPGLPHRCQFVREWRGVRFFDDSKGTNVGAVVKSVAGFHAPIVLIAGGLDKGTGYSDLLPVARRQIKCAVLIGQARELLRNALSGCTETVCADDMAGAVRAAAERAQPGDVVLLSPACASFDMYKNYAERGDDFARCVEALQ